MRGMPPGEEHECPHFSSHDQKLFAYTFSALPTIKGLVPTARWTTHGPWDESFRETIEHWCSNKNTTRATFGISLRRLFRNWFVPWIKRPKRDACKNLQSSVIAFILKNRRWPCQWDCVGHNNIQSKNVLSLELECWQQKQIYHLLLIVLPVGQKSGKNLKNGPRNSREERTNIFFWHVPDGLAHTLSIRWKSTNQSTATSFAIGSPAATFFPSRR